MQYKPVRTTRHARTRARPPRSKLAWRKRHRDLPHPPSKQINEKINIKGKLCAARIFLYPLLVLSWYATSPVPSKRPGQTDPRRQGHTFKVINFERDTSPSTSTRYIDLPTFAVGRRECQKTQTHQGRPYMARGGSKGGFDRQDTTGQDK